jgi:hypothetical protein
VGRERKPLSVPVISHVSHRARGVLACTKEVVNVGWWQTVAGRVIGDAPADYLEELARMGQLFVEPSEFPRHVRERLDALYVEALGREPTEAELLELLAFCR